MSAAPEAAAGPAAELGGLRARKRILDRLTMASLLAAFLAAGIPWFLRAFAVDLAPAARVALGYTLLYWAAAAATDRIAGVRGLHASVLLLQSSAILLLAVVWHLFGGLQSPTFLLLFFLPVMAAGLLLRPWHAAALAVLSIAAVGLVSLGESSELRWYLSRLGLPVGALPLPPLPARPEPFPGVDAQPAYVFVTLEVFSLVLLGCGFASASLARSLRRLEARAAASGEGLFHAALLAAPAPTALVDPEDGRILAASSGFVKRMLLHGEPVEGRTLFDVMRFADPGRVAELFRPPGGVLLPCAYAIGPESRLCRLEAFPVAHEGSRHACVRVEDLTELTSLAAAVAGLGAPVLVLGADDRLRYANPAAAEVFGELFLGLQASVGLARPGWPEAWWESETSPPAEPRLEAGGATFRVGILGVGLGAERLRLVTLRREKRGAAEEA